MTISTYAIAGIARSGATSSGHVPRQYVQLFVNGVNRTKYLDKFAWDVDDELNDQPNILTFECLGFTPNLNEVVTLKSSVGKEFEGRIVDRTIKYDRKNNRAGWRCKAQDYTWDLDAVSVTGRYSGSATDIGTQLRALVTGFTSTHIAVGLPSVDEIQFTFTPLSQAFRQLADRIGGDFYVDYDKDIHLFLTETDVTPKTLETSNPDWRTFSFQQSSQGIQNRIYCQGLGSTLLSGVNAGETIIPVATVDAFAAAGGQALTGNSLISYTGKTEAKPTTIMAAALKVGAGLNAGEYDYAFTYITAAGESLPSPLKVITTGLLAAPSSPPTWVLNNGTGIDDGDHQYAYTFITAEGETLPSSLSATVTTGLQTLPPPSSWTFTSDNVAGGSLTASSYYGYAVTFVTATGETTAFRIVNPGFADAANHQLNIHGIPTSSNGSVTARKIYRTSGQVSSADALTAALKLLTTIADNTTTDYNDGVADASLGAAPPSSNSATYPGNQVALSGILTGATGVTSRKVYRTAAGGSQLKLLTTIANNSATNYTDSTADSGLGANAPTSGTAVQEQVTLSAIAVGPSGTTQRKVYRTAVGVAQLQLLTTIADNVTTIYTDSTADASLGANAPTTDTSGLTIVKASTTSGTTAAGAATMTLASSTGFPTAGWVQVTTQLIRYTGVAGNQLTGIPASGNGSVQASIPTATIVNSVPILLGIPASGTGSFASSVPSGSDINLIAQADDTTSQATYGVRIGYVVDRRLSQDGADDRAAAELVLRASVREQGSYVTNDFLVRSGREITVDMNTDWGISGTWPAQRAQIRMDPNRPLAERTVMFGSHSDTDLPRVLRQIERQQTEASQ